jgi:hypothetical protein
VVVVTGVDAGDHKSSEHCKRRLHLVETTCLIRLLIEMQMWSDALGLQAS